MRARWCQKYRKEVNSLEDKTYHTDGIHQFIALHGFAGAVKIVSTALDIPEAEAKQRLELAQKKSFDII